MVTCFVPGCRNRNNKKTNVSFHAFPKNLKDEWVKAIGRDNTTLINNQRVCSEHFHDEDFERIGLLTKVKIGVVPSLKLPTGNTSPATVTKSRLKKLSGLANGENVIVHYFTSLPRIFEVVSEGSVNVGAQPEIIIPDQITAEHYGTVDDRNEYSRVDTANGHKRKTDESPNVSEVPLKMRKLESSPSTSETSNLKRRIGFLKAWHNYSRNPESSPELSKNPTVETRSKYVRFRRRQLHNRPTRAKTAARRKRKVTHLQTIVAEVATKLHLSLDAVAALEATYEGIPLEVMQQILLIRGTAGVKPSRKTFPAEIKSFAMTVQFYSCKAYEYIRQAYALDLPSPTTLRKWRSKVDCSPGISQPCIEALRIRAEEYFAKHKRPLLLSLMLDEMQIRKQLVKDQTNNIWGYCDVGSDVQYSDNRELATEALVFFVVGVNCDFKMPVAFFFVNQITGVERANVVREILHHINIDNVKILSLTCNGPNLDFKMLEELGCTVQDPTKFQVYFDSPVTGKRVFVLMDVCHMINLVRNNWARSRVLLDPDGGKIKWDYIDKLNTLKAKQTLYLDDEVRHRHLQECLMKVDTAVQTLSSSVADALELLSEDLEEFQGAKPTVSFIRRFAKWFDLFNCRNGFGRDMKAPMQKENENTWRPFLEESIQYVLNCTDGKGTPLWQTQKRVPFLGFAVMSLSLLEIYTEQICESSNLQCLLTGRFSQDHLGLFFCSLRAGTDHNPNCYQFIQTYKTLLGIKAIPEGTGTCIAKNQTGIVPFASTNKPIGLSEVQHKKLKHEELSGEKKIQLCLPLQLGEFMENVVAFMSGFVVKIVEKSISCPKCRESLRYNEAIDFTDSSMKLINRRNRFDLLLPSLSLRQICFVLEKKVQALLKIEKQLPSKSYLTTHLLKDVNKFVYNNNLFPSLDEHCFDHDIWESHHKKRLIVEVVQSYAMLRIHSLVSRRMSGAQMRKMLTDLVKFKYE